jgi:transposase
MRTPALTRRHVGELFNMGRSKASICRQLGLSKVTVDRWTNESLNHAPNMADKHRSGRPKKLKPAEVSKIKKMARPGLTATAAAQRLKDHGSLNISRHTVARIWSSGKNPLFWRPVTKVKQLSSKNKAARKSFCQQHKPTKKVKWVFLDGKVCSLYSDTNGMLSYAWQRPCEPLTKGTGSLVAHFHFYAAVAHNFKSSLHFVPPSWHPGCEGPKSKDTFKSGHYVEFMKKLARELEVQQPQLGKFSIIRDRASQHTSAKSAEDLEILDLPILKSFPAQSWDINCIEHVWAQLAAKLRIRRPTTPRGYKAAIMQEWDAITQSTINKLVEKVPSRIQKIRGLDGKWIGGYKDW